jgi:AcrR family transcriptional regulator
MINNYKRKKNPKEVRLAILNAAEKIANNQGLSCLTIQAVADEAKVTKGGFFHHFDCKQSLIDAVFDRVIDKFSESVEQYMQNDSVSRGKFSRAYVSTLFDDILKNSGNLWAAAAISMIVDPDLKRRWTLWYEKKTCEHFLTDGDLDLLTVRLAADGLWYGFILGSSGYSVDEIENIRKHLIEMTF